MTKLTSPCGAGHPATPARVACRPLEALQTLRRLSVASLRSDLPAVVRRFSRALGARHYVFAVVDREEQGRLLWSCDDADWWQPLQPELAAMMARPAASGARPPRRWFGIEPGNDAGASWPGGAGLRFGIALVAEPLRPSNLAAGFALGFGGVAGEPFDYDMLASLACHAAGLVFDAYLRLSAARGPAAVKLSARERECLRWAAVGKTSWETACILEVGERTVNFHLGNAFAKLQVNNKQAAVAQAILRGLI
ncbi:hypothetical protein GCM10023144_36880 [Pigmentiphaga soli]|uniref:HTH luxR-type domain-containing protein n=1 Tax=Pigmentiphaga soli TaxID=1007095 RepID=A0ABP8HGQ2_9BURK